MGTLYEKFFHSAFFLLQRSKQPWNTSCYRSGKILLHPEGKCLNKILESAIIADPREYDENGPQVDFGIEAFPQFHADL